MIDLEYIVAKCNTEQSINRSSTIRQTMIDNTYPIAYSFDYSKFYWHVVSKIIKQYYSDTYDLINLAYNAKHKSDFPTEQPTDAEKLKVNSFIGCLASKNNKINPLKDANIGALIRRLGYALMECTITEFQHKYNCSIIGANTDGFYFTCSEDDFSKIKANFTSPFAFKLDVLHNMNVYSDTYYWYDAEGKINIRGCYRDIYYITNETEISWVVLENSAESLEQNSDDPFFARYELKVMNPHNSSEDNLFRDRNGNWYYDNKLIIAEINSKRLFNQIRNRVKDLSVKDQLYLATQIRDKFRVLFNNSKIVSIDSQFVRYADKKVNLDKYVIDRVKAIYKKIVIDKDGNLVYDHVDELNKIQLIKKSMFIHSLFDRYISLDMSALRKGDVIIAPCGSGKTYAMCQTLNEYQYGSLVEPTKSIAWQVATKYGIPYAETSNEKKSEYEIYSPNKVFSYTNRLVDNVKNDNVAFLDEIHTAFWFNEYYNNIYQNLKHAVGVTATIPPLQYMVEKGNRFYSLNKKQTKVNITCLDMPSNAELINILLRHIAMNYQNNIDSLLYLDNKESLMIIKNGLMKDHDIADSDILLYCNSVEDDQDGHNIGVASDAEYIDNAKHNRCKITLTTLKGVTGVDYNYSNLNTIVVDNGVMNTVQAMSRNRFDGVHTVDIYLRNRLHYTDEGKVYDYFVATKQKGFTDDTKSLNQLYKHEKYLNVLVSELLKNSIDYSNITFNYEERKQRVKVKESITLEKLINAAVDYHKNGSSDIDSEQVYESHLKKFNFDRMYVAKIKNNNITYRELFEIHKCNWLSLINDYNCNICIYGNTINKKIAMAILGLTEVNERTLTNSRRSNRYNKEYPREFPNWLYQMDYSNPNKWMKTKDKVGLWLRYKDEYLNTKNDKDGINLSRNLSFIKDYILDKNIPINKQEQITPNRICQSVENSTIIDEFNELFRERITEFSELNNTKTKIVDTEITDYSDYDYLDNI